MKLTPFSNKQKYVLNDTANSKKNCGVVANKFIGAVKNSLSFISGVKNTTEQKTSKLKSFHILITNETTIDAIKDNVINEAMSAIDALHKNDMKGQKIWVKQEMEVYIPGRLNKVLDDYSEANNIKFSKEFREDFIRDVLSQCGLSDQFKNVTKLSEKATTLISSAARTAVEKTNNNIRDNILNHKSKLINLQTETPKIANIIYQKRIQPEIKIDDITLTANNTLERLKNNDGLEQYQWFV